MTRCDYAKALLFVCTLLLLGCNNSTDSTAQNNSTTSTTKYQVIDRLDRVVELDQPATRIISISPSTTELVFALDLEESIVGVTKNCNYPPAALDIQRVGAGTLESISLETIVGLKPDLVICKFDSHQTLIDSLDRLNITTLAVGAENLDELFTEAQWIGQLTNREAEAKLLVAQMQSRRDQLSEIAASVKPKPAIKVFYEVWDDPLMSAGPNSFIDEILTLAGLENIVQETSIRYPRINSELVIRANPDLILAPTTHFEDVNVANIGNRTGWETISAVQNEQIFLVSGDEVSRCGPRMLDALAEIMLIAYPQLNAADLAENEVPR